jgi:hypothetical protein
VAIILDERARATVMRRRARGKDARVVLRMDRGSLRAGVPWTLAVGWGPHRWLDATVVLQRASEVKVYTDQRIARYTQSHDLTISSARLGPWEWLVVADPFAFERMQEWERTHPEVPLPPAGVASPAETLPGRDRGGTAQRAPATRAPSRKGTTSVDSSTAVLASPGRSATGQKGLPS